MVNFDMDQYSSYTSSASVSPPMVDTRSVLAEDKVCEAKAPFADYPHFPKASSHASPQYTYATEPLYEPIATSSHTQLSQLHSIPQPDRYTLRNPRDSAYGSNSQTGDDSGTSGGLQQNYAEATCWRYPEQNWGRDQMLTDESSETLHGMGADVLMGISPGYSQFPGTSNGGHYDQYMTDEWEEDENGMRLLLVS
ncbi:hypothetical protein DL546_001721 [Coniochaeta pulveracea]|uniref:Uncharacterized protein n=1 Tax=Coniochaeta pulveracea TaxID=177199 RepID=A0A420XYT3_9PEZI|nr:hypothetical protein DL546_001721 [Coniochaeta pulveracea]